MHLKPTLNITDTYMYITSSRVTHHIYVTRIQ